MNLQLADAPERFEFFQALRLHELAALRSGAEKRSLGYDGPPSREAVRLRMATSLGFPASAFRDATPADERGRIELRQTFFGLVGSLGVLPLHYTELVLRRMQLKDTSLRDFLDLFHHRSASLFYRAWRKYRFAFEYEHVRLAERDGDDDFTRALRCLVGLGTGGLHEDDERSRRAWIHYGGLFSNPRRSQLGLAGLMSEAIGAPVAVRQFVGRWFELEPHQYSRVSARGADESQRLGVGFVVGTRVWDVQTKIALRAGPLSAAQFRALLPGSSRLRELEGLVRDYVDGAMACELELELAPGQAAPAALGGMARLGCDAFVQAAPVSRAGVVVRLSLNTDRDAAPARRSA